MSISRPKRATFRSNRESPTILDKQEDDRPASWAEAMDNKDVETFRSYSVKESYAKGDGVTHPKFGPGVVVGRRSVTVGRMRRSVGAGTPVRIPVPPKACRSGG